MHLLPRLEPHQTHPSPPLPSLKPNVTRFDPQLLAKLSPLDPKNLPQVDANGQPVQGLLAHHAVMQRGEVLGVGEGRGLGLPFDEECKLVYGVLLSLRNMAKKLSGRNELFQSYRTSTYKFHLHETPTSYKFILLTDPLADNMQFALKKIYAEPFLEYVVRNDLVGIKGGGLDETWGIEAVKGRKGG